MVKSISKLFKGFTRGRKVGFAFKVRAEIPVVEIYGEKQQAGLDMVIAVRGADLEQAKEKALRHARSLAPGSTTTITAMKDALESDLPDNEDIHMVESQAFGQSKHGRF